MATIADEPDIEVVGEVRNESDLADIVRTSAARRSDHRHGRAGKKAGAVRVSFRAASPG